MAIGDNPEAKLEIHMIGNAHLDPVWLWRWPEGLGAMRATFRSALDRMKETKGFVFTSSQAAMYEYVEKCDPELFGEIKARVAEGRWVIVGGWWVQADCNIPGNEGFVRQALYGVRYFKEKFGIDIRVGYNVDSFGHSGMLPQILKKSGMDYYVFMRPGPHEKPELPGRLFHWESPDGSRVLAYQIPMSYNSDWGDGLVEKIEKTKDELSKEQPLLMCFYGVGNHGGGPTRENLKNILAAADASKDVEILLSDPAQYFADIEARGLDFPVVRDDLQHHASGCYAVHSEIKRNNRKAEHGLTSAEKLASCAANLVGFTYPQGDLTQAWKDVLFNHFHDILPGTSIREAYEDAKHMHGRALQSADETANLALQAITAKIDTTAEGSPVVVWNPHGHRQVAPVVLELMWSPEEMTLTNDAGEEILYQPIETSAVIWPGWRRAITFVANVPAMGYAVYWLHPRQPQVKSDRLAVTDNTLANEYLELEIDPRTGYIQRMRDKTSGWDVFSGCAAVPVVIDDPSDTWSHGVFRFDKEIGRFTDAKVEQVEAGPVRGILRATSQYGRSSIIQEFALYAGLPYVDVKTTVDWREQHKVLKLEFPVNVSSPQPTYEIAFGAIQRPADGEEEPGLHWFDVSGDSKENAKQGLAIINDAKYSYDVNGNRMRLTVLRSPVYAHHIPRETEPGEFYHFIDQGIQEFTYRLVPHKGGWQEANPSRLAQELNAPMLLVEESNHEGHLPRAYSGLEIDRPNILISAVKRHENSTGYVVRVYEAHGEQTHCFFRWHQGTIRWEAEFAPFEIKTFLISDKPGNEVIELDLIERPAKIQT
jgi:alpha-mannosidase